MCIKKQDQEVGLDVISPLSGGFTSENKKVLKGDFSWSAN